MKPGRPVWTKVIARTWRVPKDRETGRLSAPIPWASFRDEADAIEYAERLRSQNPKWEIIVTTPAGNPGA